MKRFLTLFLLLFIVLPLNASFGISDKEPSCSENIKKDDTILIIAVQDGDYDQVLRLLKISDYSKEEKNKALFKALYCGEKYKIIKALLDEGADVNARNERGATPIMYAKNVRIARLLIKEGADIKAVTADKDGENITVLIRYMSCPEVNLDVIKYLISQGADYKARSKEWTPFLAAAAKGHIEVLALLLDKGVDINETVKGMTALTWAAVGQKYDTVEFLLQRGASASTGSREGINIISLAREQQDKELLRLLKKYRMIQ